MDEDQRESADLSALGEDNTPHLVLDGRREEIRRELRGISAEAEAFYLGAIAVIEARIPAASYFVAHAAREIEALLEASLVVTPGERSREARDCNNGEGGQTHREKMGEALGLGKDDLVVRHWHKVAEKLPKLVHRRSSEQPRPLEDVLPLWEQFEDILHALLGPFYGVFSEIDDLLANETPTALDVDRLKAALVRRGRERQKYFFDRLEHPAWLGPLDDAGFFSNPFWPESGYLARMASEDPEAVHGIILRALGADDIENVRVLGDFVDAALAMPVDLAAGVARQVSEWPGPYRMLLPNVLGKLMRKLAEGGDHRGALELGRGLLHLEADEEAIERVRERGVALGVLPEARTAMALHDYESILEDHFPAVVDAAGLDALALACDLLATALEIEECDPDGPDYSSIWRPAVEDHPQNLRHGLKERLVEAVRDAAVRLVKDRPAQAQRALDLLQEQRYPIFRRVALYVLSLNPSIDEARAAARIGDRDLFEDEHVRHEYYLLVRAYFASVPDAVRERVLGWIEAGPDDEEIATKWDGTESTPEEMEEVRRYWRRDKLSLFTGLMPPRFEAEYQALTEELDKPSHPEFASYSETRVGIPSPKSSEELGELPIEELVAFLREWEPEEGVVWGPEPEGLGHALMGAVKLNPSLYADHADEFRGLQPRYVREVLSGLREVCRSGDGFSWERVLALCDWVMHEAEDAVPIAPESTGRDDPDWGWTRKAIADLLGQGLQRDQIPFALRESVWALIATLTRDLEPTPEHEDKYGGGSRGPAGLAINTVRGEAIHGVMHYALWCAGNLRPGDCSLTEGHPFWNEIPEVEEVLDWHLDPVNDPSPAIRSVYGRFLPQLVLLGPDWTAGNLTRIFPEDPEQLPLRAAAWDAYLVFNHLYSDTFSLLRDEYGRAVEDLADVPQGEPVHGAPETRLAEHLAILYWWGTLAVDDPLLERFFETASVETRGAVVKFVGRILGDMETDLQPEVAERIGILLEARIAAAQADDDVASAEELAAFGWWFESGKLDDEWCLARLLEVLELTGGEVDFDRRVATQLVVMARDHPVPVVECFRMMVEGDDEGWRVMAWRQQLNDVLRAALASGLDEARDRAECLINTLGEERGYHEHRGLLDG